MSIPGIELGKVTEALNEKADRGLLNIENNTDAVLAYQTPTAENNYTWYRIYKSGWVEQGSRIPNSSSDITTNVIFSIPMADTYYTLIGSEITATNSMTNHNHASVGYNKTTTGFTSDMSTAGWKDWYACGQGDPNAVRNAIIEKMIEAGTSVNYSIANLTDYIIAYQEPTSENNYTWYRVYNSGWVEQGGITAHTETYGLTTVHLPITMSNSNYYINASIANLNQDWFSSTAASALQAGVTDVAGATANYTTTSFDIQKFSIQRWEVKGQGDATVIAEMIANNVLHNSVNTYITETQLPTAQNDYTWYKKYSNGWIEQGGTIDVANGLGSTITLIKPMLDGNYQVFLQASNAAGYQSYWVVRTAPTSSNFVIHSDYTGATKIFWEVRGMAANPS